MKKEMGFSWSLPSCLEGMPKAKMQMCVVTHQEGGQAQWTDSFSATGTHILPMASPWPHSSFLGAAAPVQGPPHPTPSAAGTSAPRLPGGGDKAGPGAQSRSHSSEGRRTKALGRKSEAHLHEARDNLSDTSKAFTSL